jgi:hypothetical protein
VEPAVTSQRVLDAAAQDQQAGALAHGELAACQLCGSAGLPDLDRDAGDGGRRWLSFRPGRSPALDGHLPRLTPLLAAALHLHADRSDHQGQKQQSLQCPERAAHLFPPLRR